MKIDILTLFPKIFDNFFTTSILGRAQTKKIAKIKTYNLRQWGLGRYRQVDDRPYGGGPGMIMRFDVVYNAIKSLKRKMKKKCKIKIILPTPRGKIFDQKMAQKLAREKHLIFICPHYEGYDERIASLADYKISIGNYILTGGEIPALAIIDSVVRLLPSAIKPESLLEESFSMISMKSETQNPEQTLSLKLQKSNKLKNYEPIPILEYPQYTRPEIFEYKIKGKIIKKRVPKVLLSGHHAEIEKWRKQRRKITKL